MDAVGDVLPALDVADTSEPEDTPAANDGAVYSEPESDGSDGSGSDGSAGPIPIPLNAVACDYLAHWPLHLQSAMLPLSVHYEQVADAATAATVLSILEATWETQTTTLGFRPPLQDGGLCGPDDDFDAFLWRGQPGYVAWHAKPR